MSEQRTSQRKRVLKGGLIAFNGGRSTISCTVRNLSEGGALLKVASAVGIPPTFDLVLSDGTKHRCAIVQNSTDEIRVRFETTGG